MMTMMMWRGRTGAWKHSRNKIFKKTSEVIITRSKWLVAFLIDLIRVATE